MWMRDREENHAGDNRVCVGLAALGAAAIVASMADLRAQQATGAVSVGGSDLGGVVTGPGGPEAGVWVIAETTDLPTKFAKMVATDDQGRYLIPELPNAKFKVWVRGYGLVDSPKVDGEPGKTLNLTAVKAPSEKEAAQYYPPIYWYSLLRVPAPSEFPAGPVKTQPEWVNGIKSSGCMSCHALGSPGTRTVPKAFSDGAKDSAEAWARRIQAGQAQAQWPATLDGSTRNARSNCSASGPTALPPASCRSTSRRGRRASSATS
jgi:hypothetical protein